MGISDIFGGPVAPKLNRCLGISLRLDAGYLCETHLDAKDGVKVDRLIRVPFPAFAKEATARSAAMNVSFFSNEAKWPELLAKAVKEAGWRSNKAVVSLSSQFGIQRYFVMPQIQRRFWKQSVPLESKKYIPIAFEDAVYDFQVQPLEPAADGKSRMGVIFGITHCKILEFLRARLKDMGLESLSFEMFPSSCERLFTLLHKEEAGGRGCAHFDSDTSYVMFSENGYPVLLREVSAAAAAQVTERRRFDIRGSMDFVSKQLGHQVCDAITISGENLSVWKSLVEKESGLGVREWNPGAMLGLKSADWPVYACIGASLRFQADTVLDLDISGKSRASIETRMAVFYIWLAGLFVAGFLLILCVINQARLMSVRRDLAAKKASVNDIVEFRGQSAESIEVMVDKTKAKAASLSLVFSGKGFITSKLEGIVNTIPENIWISDLTYTDSIVVLPGVSSNNELRITGHVQSETDEITEADKFKEGLKLNKAFSVSYAPPAGSIELSIDPSSSRQGTARGGRKEAVFSIICRKKRAS